MTKTMKTFKPEFKHETLTGKFTDYRGNERDFTMVAVSIPMKDEDAIVTRPVEYETSYEVPAKNVLNEETGQIGFVPARTETYVDEYDEVLAPVTKMLSIGVAVRCVRDEDKGLGEQIAYGKAITLLNHTLYVSHSGMINTKMVRALLEQEADYFVKDPGSYITGYNADKLRFEATGQIAEAEMTADEIKAHNIQKKKDTGKLRSVKNTNQNEMSKAKGLREKFLNEANISKSSYDKTYHMNKSSYDKTFE